VNQDFLFENGMLLESIEIESLIVE